MTTTKDPYDELTSMYLTEPTADDTPRAASAAELLLVGHLPVRASLWLGPYMDAVAREHGATAMVRLDGEEPALQLVADDRHEATFAKARSLRELTLGLRGVVRRWVIRPPADATPETLLAAGPDRVTLLSSGDQAALVHGYKLVKEMALAADQLGRPRPRIGVAMLGVDRDRADVAIARLSATTGAYLDMDIPLVCALPRIDTGPQAGGLRSFPGHACPALDELMGWLRSPASSSETAPAVETPAPPPPAAPPTRRLTPLVLEVPGPDAPLAPHASHAPAALHAPPLPDVVDQPQIERSESPLSDSPARAIAREIAAPSAPLPPHLRAAQAAVTSGGRAKLAPKGVTEVEPKHPAPMREPDDGGRPVALSSYVPGLRPLPARCPDHESVELAVDGRGRLHLLATESTQRSVPVVESWTMAHRELIGMACPNETIDPSRRPVTHLFFGDALRAAFLNGSAIALHLLTTVEVEGRTGWYVTTLSSPRGALPAGGARRPA